MAKGWYVLHTYSGYENKIEKKIRLLMEDDSLEGAVFDIKVPSEEVTEVKDGKKRVVNRKFLPGYVLLEMDLPNLGWKNVVTKIKRIDGVTGFVGAAGNNIKPQPISQDEARSILMKTGEIKADKGYRSTQSFVEGEQIRVVDGPFESFTGSIEEVNLEKGKLKVTVGIFGRSTPVEVDFSQVEKI